MSLHPDHAAHWPKAAASAAIFRNDELLIVERGKGEMAGLWSFPGGHVAPGEAVKAAAEREVIEETGIRADIRALVNVHDVIVFGHSGELQAHYIINIFCGIWLSGAPQAGSDARQARFVRMEDFKDYRLTDGMQDYAEQAARILYRCSAR